jgi:hypothetical protein
MRKTYGARVTDRVVKVKFKLAKRVFFKNSQEKCSCHFNKYTTKDLIPSIHMGIFFHCRGPSSHYH